MILVTMSEPAFDEQRPDDVPSSAPVTPAPAGPAQPPPTSQQKRVGWPELFFDLVFVVAVTRVSGVLEDDHGWLGLVRAIVVFVPIYWLWVGTAIQTNQGDITRPGLRLKVLWWRWPGCSWR